MSATKEVIQKELQKMGLKTDDNCLNTCLSLYTTHGFENVGAFVSAVDAHAFYSSSKALNPSFFTSFDNFLSSQRSVKVSQEEEEDFFGSSGSDGLDMLGIAVNTTGLVTPPMSPASGPSSPVEHSDRKRKGDLTTPSTRTKPSTPWTERFGTPHDYTRTRHKDSGLTILTLPALSAPAADGDLFSQRGEDVKQPEVIDIGALRVAKPAKARDTQSKNEEEVKVETSSAMTDDAALSLFAPDTSSLFSVDIPLPTPSSRAAASAEAPPFRHMEWDHAKNLALQEAHTDHISECITESAAFAQAVGEAGDENYIVANVDHASSEEFYYIGRIRDGDHTSTRLNAGNLTLTGMEANKFREVSIRLGHPDLKNYALFPGQVVILRGTNTTGKAIVANTIFSQTTLPKYDRASLGLPPVQRDTPLRIAYACGPYSRHSQLDADALGVLLDALVERKTTYPDVLVLSGPFLDEDHPSIATPPETAKHTIPGCAMPIFGGTSKPPLTATYATMFHTMLERIDQRFEEVQAHTKVILVPSLKDVHHHNCFPQPAFSCNPNPDRFICVANPSLFDIEGVLVATTSMDVLMEMSKQELSFSKPDPSLKTENGVAPSESPYQKRIIRLLTHFLSQQSLVPLSTIPMDRTLEEQARATLRLPYLPDLMLIPSKLKHFAERVPVPGNVSSRTDLATVPIADTIIAVNAESAVKGETLAMFATITVHPGEGSVSDRTSVEIIRL